jgi:hypothetical protein
VVRDQRQKAGGPRHRPRLIRYNYARISSLPTVFVLAIGISFFSTAAAGYSVLLLFFVRPLTNLYARRQLS